MQNFVHAYSAYIFDFDGTLSDSAGDVIASMHAALAAHKLPAQSISRFNIGPPIGDMFHELLPDLAPEAIEQLVVTFREIYNTSGTPLTVLFPGIIPLLDRLAARGARLFVATNKSKTSAFPILERLGVLPRFTCVMCGDSLLEELGRGISKAEMISHILTTCAIAPQDAVMIGDSTHDVEGGRKAGVHTVGVLYGYGRPEDVLAAGPEMVMDDPAWKVCLA